VKALPLHLLVQVPSRDLNPTNSNPTLGSVVVSTNELANGIRILDYVFHVEPSGRLPIHNALLVWVRSGGLECVDSFERIKDQPRVRVRNSFARLSTTLNNTVVKANLNEFANDRIIHTDGIPELKPLSDRRFSCFVRHQIASQKGVVVSQVSAAGTAATTGAVVF